MHRIEFKKIDVNKAGTSSFSTKMMGGTAK